MIVFSLSVDIGEEPMLEKKDKQKIIAKFATHAGDTGSTQVQVAILSEEISRLSEHLQTHRKDFSSRRGLLKKIGERRRLLRYLHSEDPKEYEELVKKLKLKKRVFADKKDDDFPSDLIPLPQEDAA